MSKRGKLFSTFFFAAAIASLLLFQNCSQVHYALTGDQSLSSPKVPELAASEGGEVYDGKPRILHHYVPGFQCEGRPQPESILFSQDDTNWRLIQNSPEKCAVQDKVPVTGVVYNSGTNQALYLGKTYVPPIPFYVDASEDPNLPDIKLEDGVCENTNNKCSLLAAVQQAGVVSYTTDSIVEIPSATYNMTTFLDLNLSTSNNSVLLRGAPGPDKPILNAQGRTTHLYIRGASGSVDVENLIFENGFLSNFTRVEGGQLTSSSINLKSHRVALNILDSEFISNSGSSVIDGGSSSGPIAIRRSQFKNNTNLRSQSGVIDYTGVGGMLIEDTVFGGSSTAVYVRGPTKDFTVNRSAFYGTSIWNYFGLFVEDCFNCIVQNTVIYGYGYSGLVIKADLESGPDAGLKVINSTILANGAGGSTNIQLRLQGKDQKAEFINSVVATSGVEGMGEIGNTNCDTGGANAVYFHNIVATNSLFNDTSCPITGSGNIIGLSPRFGPYGDYGGLMPTLLPQPGSPLIDAGDNNFCPTLDQRGLFRPVDKLGSGSRCDIGAVELQ